MSVSKNNSKLAEANRAFAEKKYHLAKLLYKQALRDLPALNEFIWANIQLVEARLARCEQLKHGVVVCVHNALEDTKLCLESLKKERTVPYSLVIVDDFSSDDTSVFLQQFQAQHQDWVKLIRTHAQSGYTKAVNLGLKHSDSDVITLLNSDTIATLGWSEKIIEHFAIYPYLGVVGVLSNAASSQSVPGIQANGLQTAINDIPDGFSAQDIANYLADRFSVDDMPYVPLIHGFCLSVRKSLLNEVGLFDEELFPRGYGEETDFCLRAQDAGYTLGIAMNTYIYHSKSKSYSSASREQNMLDGWNNLVGKYGKTRLKREIAVMENHPLLKQARDDVYKAFYTLNQLGEIGGREGALAFYLPQFHPIPENDMNWGRGFTEWTNVTKCQPRYPGHFQPKLPSELGFYDLRLSEVMTQQSILAKEHGLLGFCFYYYRFGKKRVMDLPLDLYKKNQNAVLPYCFCWANESWTRAWDGKTSELLFEQTYEQETRDGIVQDLAQASLDDKYIKINDRVLFLIYQAAEIPNLRDFTDHIRSNFNKITGKDLIIGTVYSHNFIPEVLESVEFVVQFPPHRLPRNWKREILSRESMSPYNESQQDFYEDYDEVSSKAIQSCQLLDKMFPGVCPDWDNSARRAKNANILVGSTPEKFQQWVKEAMDISRDKYNKKNIPSPFIFVNAWNEWAEGAILEPSSKYGRAYLEALKFGLNK